MAEQNAIELIRGVFTSPLPDGRERRVVFWHDVEGSFSDDFDALAQEGFGVETVRLLVFARTDEGSVFQLKRDILRERADCDFLVYTPTPRDFSEGGLQGNWLADVELVAEHFQADKASMLMGELNASAAARDAIGRFGAFFNAQGRRAEYLKRMPQTSTPADVATGVVAALLKAPTARVEDVIWAWLAALHRGDGDALLSELEKFDALAALSALLKGRVGYAGDPTSEAGLAEHLLMSAASLTLPDAALTGYETHIAREYARFCLNIVRDWLGREADRGTLYEICRTVEGELNLPDRFATLEAADLLDCDVFPCANEAILAKLMGSMAEGADRSAEALAARQKRKDLKWYKRVAPYFDLLAAAADAEGFYRAHPKGFHEATAKDAWRAYTSDWCSMDAAYRAVCTALDACQLKVEDVTDALRDAAEALAAREEGLYANWFLPGANACWVNLAEGDWDGRGFVPGIDRQRDFFSLRVKSGFRDFKRTLVIVSDGMRYEVGREVARRLEQETKGAVELRSMQSSFPSVTEFGMAALLPNSQIAYSWDTGQVTVDGMPTGNSAEREKALRTAVPGARAVTADQLRAGNRAARRELVGNAPLVYVYQDKIDSTGEKPKLERDVLEACEKTVEEVVALAKIAVNDLKINRVLVTADHGFIYTRGALKEQDKLGKADIGDAGDVQMHRRHILSRHFVDSMLLVRMDMSDVAGGEYYGLAPRECIRLKSQGGTKNYAHGGVSLQETCVPVIELRNKNSKDRGRVDQEKATVRLVSTERSITSSMFHVDLLQPEPVSGKVLPAEYELVLTDGSGNPVTDVQKAHADMATEDKLARTARPMFTLKAGIDYPAGERYWLVCRDRETGEIAWKEEFTVDMGFAPTVDFGF